ncbi:MAG TPA: beta-propeller fold lactonase family protein [Vicinamibacterales bacterium]|jgi:YVTN family beta-propeller protein
MTVHTIGRVLIAVAGLFVGLITWGAPVRAQSATQLLPNMGQQITPLAVQGASFESLNPNLPDNPTYLAGQAVTTVVSPDRKTLLVLTSGYNRVFFSTGPNVGKVNPSDSAEYVFVYDISTSTPVKTQVLRFANTYNGIVFDPSGAVFYVAGGSDDVVHLITRSDTGTWQERSDTPALVLGHATGLGLAVPPQTGTVPINDRVAVKPCAAGVAISKDGLTLVVANYYNDSITIFNKKVGFGYWWKVTELDLRPGKSNPLAAGVPGGEYPFWVAITGTGSNAHAYVSSIRDREVVVVDLGGAPAVTARIRVKGQPIKMTLNAAQSLLYVVEDQSDTVDVIDTATNTILESIPVIAPVSLLPAWLAPYTGANPNSVTLSPDETQLYVTNGNLNCVAVVALGGTNRGDHVIGLIPTGWYPNSVSFSRDGNTVYVVNGKSPTGPNPGFCYGGYGPPGSPNCMGTNQYNPQLIKAGFQRFPRPTTAQLATLTAQVAANNRFTSSVSAHDAAVMAAVRRGVQHVIFIIKENRTYDQVLGDLKIGNGDPALAEFGEAVTPNLHNLARTFVTLDNFYDTSEVSYDGWPWTTSARAPDVIQRQVLEAYAGRGFSLDSEGLNRSVNVAYPTLGERQAANPFTPADPDLLAGQTDVAAPDGPNNQVNTGYLWDSALRAKLSVRNYGFFLDITRYSTQSFSVPLVHDPASTGTVVAFPASVSLAPFTDLFFRGFDNAFPDFYRYMEWAREFDGDYRLPLSSGESTAAAFGPRSGGLPALSLVRLMHDHTGDYLKAIDGVNTPELQQADNDYAVGLLIQKIAISKYANNTLIFVIEDDAQDGGDHVDSHRSVAFVAGAYVKQGALVSTRYNTIDFVRTIEEVLGLPPMNLNDALAKPMADIFTTTPHRWYFAATPAAMLYRTSLPLPPKPAGLVVPAPTHDAAYWAEATKGMDFTSEDRFDFAAYNRILWTGLMGAAPYPAAPTGLDLRKNRKEFLAKFRQAATAKGPQQPPR